MAALPESDINELLAMEEPYNPTTDEPNIVLYGAGNLGRFTIQAMRDAGRLPVAICDSNPRLWGTNCEGVEVMAIDKAILVHPKALYVVTIYNGASMRKKLRSIGVRVGSFAQLYRARLMNRTGPPLPHGSIDDIDKLRRNAESIRIGAELWADAASRREYLAQIQYRVTLDDACLPPALLHEQMYFPPEIPWKEHECFVDCGAFDGDSIRAFLSRRPYQGDRIVAIEPDPYNAERLRQSLAASKTECRVVDVALGERFGSHPFKAIGTAGSSLDKDGQMAVDVRALDYVLAGETPTRIKMDIEGAELPALRGAIRTLQQHKPAMAVCIYHRTEDLWEIPAFLKMVVPEYDLFNRRYGEDCWELVCYAVKR